MACLVLGYSQAYCRTRTRMGRHGLYWSVDKNLTPFSFLRIFDRGAEVTDPASTHEAKYEGARFYFFNLRNTLSAKVG